MHLPNVLISATAAMLLATTSYAADPVKIGMITTLSGPAGYLGQDIRDGFKLAMDMEGGKLGGIAVELLVEDDGLKPGQGKQIAERWLDDGQLKLFTGIVFSNVAGATVPEIVDRGAFYVSPNAGPSNLAGAGCNKNYFVVSWQNDSLHESSGQLATNFGYKTAFVLAPNYQAGKDAIEGFKRFFKGTIVGEVFTKLDQTDFAAELAQIRAAKPEVVFQFHPGGQGIAFLRQYGQAGLARDMPMVLGEASLDNVILAAVGDMAIGLYSSSHWNADFDNPATKAFVEAWRKTYNRPVTTYASQGYDTALAFASALKATGGDLKDANAFRQAMRKADFQSVRGAFAFGPNQHPIQDWYALKVDRGADGKPDLKTVSKVFSNHGDAYSSACKL